ncbi:MAG TPA: GNAT family N-acetyltransferase [Pyrinomonadaceae bacterium]
MEIRKRFAITQFMSYRPYETRDLVGVVDIFRSNIPKYFDPGEEAGLRDFLAEFSDNYFVGELDGQVVGAGGVVLNDEQTISLCWGMVRSDHLGTGLGRDLTQFRIEKARENFGNLPLVISTSQHTRGFYERFGFRLLEHVPDGFGPGIDICKMRLDP